MSLSQEMTQLTVGFSAAREERSKAIADISDTVLQNLAEERATLRRTMAAHARTMETDLKAIFSEAAFIRGAAEDLIDRFTTERHEAAQALKAELEQYTSNLGFSVEQHLHDLAKLRKASAAKEADARRKAISILHTQVEALLGEASKYIEDLRRDRQRANRTWKQHSRSWEKPRRKAARRAATEPAAQISHAVADKSASDDLTDIKGIGPVMERRLKTLGIHTFRDLGAADAGKLTDELKASQPMLQQSIVDAWIAAARERA